MKKLLKRLGEELAAGRGAVLCSVVDSQGSAPRGAGARLLLLENGETTGTVGGGAVEYRAVELAGELLKRRSSHLQSYRLSPGGAEDTGMICGGGVEIYFQYFDPADPAAQRLIAESLLLLESGRASWLVTEIGEDAWHMGLYDRQDGLRGLEVPPERLEPLLGAQGRLDGGPPALYVEPLCSGGTVYLFGGGHVARALAKILAMADFRVVVWDQRPQAEPFFPDAAAFHCGPFAGALEKLPPVTQEDYAVIMTPGHQWDCEVLSQVLRTPAKYIGCIGSRSKTAAARERLLAGGFSGEEIDRVYAPIGLPIGGKAPAEVAVSVAAQLIACRYGRLEGFPREFLPERE